MAPFIFTPCLNSLFRTAMDEEIQAWSFGAVSRLRNRKTTDDHWHNQKGTLDDEAIFGPSVDFQCSCRRYCGREYREIICEICGVKIMSSREARSSRFGHINLSGAINHTICDPPVLLNCFPVLPAYIRSSNSGRALNTLYEQMISASLAFDIQLLQSLYDD
jgi:hypothetical protein